MYIGLGIFLIVVGAILTFALNASVDAVNLGMIGWICMAAGALAIVLSLAVTRRATAGYSARTGQPHRPGHGLAGRRGRRRPQPLTDQHFASERGPGLPGPLRCPRSHGCLRFTSCGECSPSTTGPGFRSFPVRQGRSAGTGGRSQQGDSNGQAPPPHHQPHRPGWHRRRPGLRLGRRRGRRSRRRHRPGAHRRRQPRRPLRARAPATPRSAASRPARRSTSSARPAARTVNGQVRHLEPVGQDRRQPLRLRRLRLHRLRRPGRPTVQERARPTRHPRAPSRTTTPTAARPRVWTGGTSTRASARRSPRGGSTTTSASPSTTTTRASTGVTPRTGTTPPVPPASR